MINHLISFDKKYEKLTGQALFERDLERYFLEIGAEDFGRYQIFRGNSQWQEFSKNLIEIPEDARLLRVHNYGIEEGFAKTILCSMDVNYKRILGEIRLEDFKNKEMHIKLKLDLQVFVNNWPRI